MPYLPRLDIAGLQVDRNQLTKANNAGLVMAKNVEILKPGILTPRRGFTYAPQPDGTAAPKALVLAGSDYVFSLKLNQISKYALRGGATSTGNTLTGCNPAFPYGANAKAYVPNDTSVYAPAVDYVVNFLNYGGGTTNPKPVYRTSNPSGTTALLSIAGVPRCNGLDRDKINFTAGSTLSNQFACLYRFVFRRTSTGELGAPSPAFLVTNTTGAGKAVQFQVGIPAGIGTDMALDYYRTPGAASPGSNIIPADECQYAGTYTITATDRTNFFTGVITDTLPDSSLGAALYTNQSQEGSIQENSPPPLCRDSTDWQGFRMFAAPRQPTALIFQDGGVANGAGSSITFDVGTFVARAAPNPALAEFQTASSTLQSPYYLASWFNYWAAWNAVNANGTSLVYLGPVALTNLNNLNAIATAYAASANWGAVAYVRDRVTLGTNGAGTLSMSSAYVQPGSLTVSDSADAPGLLLYSKYNQPESCPQTNTIVVGASSEAIRRIVVVHESLIVFKDDGIFRVTGTNASTFRTSRISAYGGVFPLTVAGCADGVFALTPYGAIYAIETSVETIDDDTISTELAALTGGVTPFSSGTCATVVYPDNKYVIYTTDSSGATVAFVYCSYTKNWTKHEYFSGTRATPIRIQCALSAPVSPGSGSTTGPIVTWLGTDKPLAVSWTGSAYLYNGLYIENHVVADTDYLDVVSNYVNITAGNGTANLTITDTSGGIGAPRLAMPGALIYQAGGPSTTIVSATDTSIVTATAQTWNLGASIFIAYPLSVQIQFVPVVADDVQEVKQFSDLVMLWKYITTGVTWTGTTTSEFTPAGQAITFTSSFSGRQATRCGIPTETKRARWLNIGLSTSLANQYFQLEGFMVGVNSDSKGFRNG